VKVSLSSTSHYSIQAAEAIKDLSPNAADVMVTSVITSMVTDLGVVSPTAGGLLTYYDAGNGSTNTVDGYFVSPKNFNGNDHEEHKISMSYGGYVETCKGGNTFAIPGIYKILELIHTRYGSIPLEKLFEYPIELAKNGFTLPQPSKDYLIHSLEPLFMWHPTSENTLQSVFNDLENGVVVLSKLSDSLSHMANEGFSDFYYGDISKEIISTVQKEGGHATVDDFVNYGLIENSKFTTEFRGLELTGHAGPSIGGLMVLKYLHALAGDEVNIKENLMQVYEDRKNHYEFFGNRSTFIYNEISKISQSSSTIQVNTSDESNNHFSLTFSSGYGSGVQCSETGMFLNNSLGEIELNPQGFLGETSGDRLISNMSPLIIKTHKGIVTIGSPGADRISSALAQVLYDYSLNANWVKAIVKPRFHVNIDGTIRCEPDTYFSFSEQITTNKNDMYFGGVCVTALEEQLFTKGDPRRGDFTWTNVK
jgi:gamma-glutamyltranspeptidase/glutathione hydrolase